MINQKWPTPKTHTHILSSSSLDTAWNHRVDPHQDSWGLGQLWHKCPHTTIIIIQTTLPAPEQLHSWICQSRPQWPTIGSFIKLMAPMLLLLWMSFQSSKDSGGLLVVADAWQTGCDKTKYPVDHNRDRNKWILHAQLSRVFAWITTMQLNANWRMLDASFTLALGKKSEENFRLRSERKRNEVDHAWYYGAWYGINMGLNEETLHCMKHNSWASDQLIPKWNKLMERRI